MGKNSKKLRRQDYPSPEEMEKYEMDEEQDSSPRLPKSTANPRVPTRSQTDTSATRGASRKSYQEGMLLSTGKVSGTAIHVCDDIVLLLDSDGIIHELKYHQVYPSQD